MPLPQDLLFTLQQFRANILLDIAGNTSEILHRLLIYSVVVSKMLQANIFFTHLPSQLLLGKLVNVLPPYFSLPILITLSNSI